jgi:hypothetical protein
MALFPVVESPCPAGKGVPTGASEHCSLCERSVHNLDRMSDRERREFMGACSAKVCVAYTVRMPRRSRTLGVTALAAVALASLPAAADTPDSPATADPPMGAMSPVPGREALPNCDEMELVIVGGVAKGDQAEWADDGKDAPPDLPTIEDDGR